MKPFALDKALAGAKVVTRDGRPVKIAGYNEDAEGNHQVVGWIEKMSSEWSVKGVYNSTVDSHKDLFMAPTTRKEWIVRVTTANGNNYVIGPYDSPEQCAHIMPAAASSTLHEITITE